MINRRQLIGSHRLWYRLTDKETNTTSQMIWDETQTFTQRSPGWTDTSHCALGVCSFKPSARAASIRSTLLTGLESHIKNPDFLHRSAMDKIWFSHLQYPFLLQSNLRKEHLDLTPLFPGRDKPTFVWLGTVTSSQERSCSPSEWLHGRDALPATAWPPPCWAWMQYSALFLRG